MGLEIGERLSRALVPENDFGGGWEQAEMNSWQRAVFRLPIWLRATLAGALFGSAIGGTIFLATQSLGARLFSGLAIALLIGINGFLHTAKLKRAGVEPPRTLSEAIAQGRMQGGDWTISKAILGGIAVGVAVGMTVYLADGSVEGAASGASEPRWV